MLLRDFITRKEKLLLRQNTVVLSGGLTGLRVTNTQTNEHYSYYLGPDECKTQLWTVEKTLVALESTGLLDRAMRGNPPEFLGWNPWNPLRWLVTMETLSCVTLTLAETAKLGHTLALLDSPRRTWAFNHVVNLIIPPALMQRIPHEQRIDFLLKTGRPPFRIFEEQAGQVAEISLLGQRVEAGQLGENVHWTVSMPDLSGRAGLGPLTITLCPGNTMIGPMETAYGAYARDPDRFVSADVFWRLLDANVRGSSPLYDYDVDYDVHLSIPDERRAMNLCATDSFTAAFQSLGEAPLARGLTELTADQLMSRIMAVFGDGASRRPAHWFSIAMALETIGGGLWTTAEFAAIAHKVCESLGSTKSGRDLRVSFPEKKGDPVCVKFPGSAKQYFVPTTPDGLQRLPAFLLAFGRLPNRTDAAKLFKGAPGPAYRPGAPGPGR